MGSILGGSGLPKRPRSARRQACLKRDLFSGGPLSAPKFLFAISVRARDAWYTCMIFGDRGVPRIRGNRLLSPVLGDGRGAPNLNIVSLLFYKLEE